MKIIYLGTPEFAVAPLEALYKAGYNICAVVTMPDKPAGRGLQLQESPVKTFATAHNIPVLQPEKLKNEDFIAALNALKPDLGIVVAFRMLPEVVWQLPKLGTFNLHASLLPHYRGAAPINHAIINGDTETGVTTFFLKHEIDTGNILMQEKVEIAPEDNIGTLYSKLMHIGAELVVKTVQNIEKNSITEIPQADYNPDIHRSAPKIFKDFTKINFNQSAENVHNHIRGLSPYPAAFTTINGKQLKIFKSEILAIYATSEPSSYTTDNKNFIHYNCKDGILNVLELQLEGKKRMEVKDFLRGNVL